MFTHGLIEIILYVQDMAAQVAFYRDNFQLPVLYPPTTTDFGNEYWVVLDSGMCKLALHAGGQKRLGADTPKIVFGVDDIQAARAWLLQQNVNMSEVRSPAPGVTVCDGFDPEGNPFSIEHRE